MTSNEALAIAHSLESVARVIKEQGFPKQPMIVGSQNQAEFECQFFLALWRSKSEDRDTTIVGLKEHG